MAVTRKAHPSTPAPQLFALQQAIGGTIRISRRGVPHLLIERAGVTDSVCYFGRLKLFRSFHPYGPEMQERRDMTLGEAVAAYGPAR